MTSEYNHIIHPITSKYNHFIQWPRNIITLFHDLKIQSHHLITSKYNHIIRWPQSMIHYPITLKYYHSIKLCYNQFINTFGHIHLHENGNMHSYHNIHEHWVCWCWYCFKKSKTKRRKSHQLINMTHITALWVKHHHYHDSFEHIL